MPICERRERRARLAQAVAPRMSAEVKDGPAGLPMVRLEHEASMQTAEIHAVGATVASWTVSGAEVLFASKSAVYDGSKPIRAGIPLCFPQFGPYGDLPTHGFARNVQWKVIEAEDEADGSAARAVFELTSESDSPLVQAWNKSFRAELIVTLSASGLETSLFVDNTGSEPFEFTFSLHNYFLVTDIEAMRVFGLENLKVIDRMANGEEGTQSDDEGAGLNVDTETDKIYKNAPEELAMLDTASLRLIKMKKTSTLPDATLWNPFGSEGCDAGWREFICLEPAAVSTPAKVQPGERWIGGQLLQIE